MKILIKILVIFIFIIPGIFLVLCGGSTIIFWGPSVIMTIIQSRSELGFDTYSTFLWLALAAIVSIIIGYFLIKGGMKLMNNLKQTPQPLEKQEDLEIKNTL